MNNILHLEELERERKVLKNPEIDYTKITKGKELLDLLKDDGMQWSLAFCQHTKKHLDIDIDPYYAVSWFANAIEGSNDYRNRIKEESEKEELLFLERAKNLNEVANSFYQGENLKITK